MPRRTTAVVVLALGLVTTACGARLTPAQLAALNASGAGSSGQGSSLGPGGASDDGAGSAGSSVGSSSSVGAGGGATASASSSTHQASTNAATSAVPGLSVANSVCSGPADAPGVSSSQVDLGTVTTLTGPVPGIFQDVVYGVDAFAAYMNSVGGICGRKVVFDVADDDLDASQNQTATSSLANSVFAFVGSFSGVDQGGASVIQQDDIPYVAEAISQQAEDIPQNFSPTPVPCGLNLAAYQYLAQKDPAAATHMAVLSLNQPTDLYETQCQQEALESIGYKFVYSDENIALTQSDFSSDAQAMKAAGAEGLLFIATAAYYAEVATAMQNAGLAMQLPTYDDNAYDPAFIPQAGSAADGATIFSPVEMYQGEDAGSNPVISLFDKYFEAVSGGTPPNEYGLWSWMDGMLFVEGLNNGGGLTRAALMNGLSKVTSFTGGNIQGPADPAAKKPPLCWIVIDVVNQKFVRDAGDPPTGLNCPSTNTYDYVTNVTEQS